MTLLPRSMLSALLLAAASMPAIADLDEGRRHKQAQRLDQAERAFLQVVTAEPDNIEALAELATVQGWQGRYEDAITTWQQALAMVPESPELGLGLARVLYWSGRRDAALAALDPILEHQPAHYDALLLRGDVLIAMGDRAGARHAYQRAAKLPAGQDTRDLTELIARTDPPLRYRVDSGYAHEDFDNFRGTESGAYVQAGAELNEVLSGYLRWDRLNQFDQVDHQFVAGAYWRLTPDWTLFAEAGGTPEADFRPRTQAQSAVEWRAHPRLQTLLGYRYFGYPFGEVHSLIPGLRLTRLGPGSLEWRHAISRNTDESTTGVTSLRYAWHQGRFLPYLSLYVGEEALPPQPQARFTTYAAGCVFTLSRRWSLRLDYAYEDRPDFYRHQTAAVGATVRF